LLLHPFSNPEMLLPLLLLPLVLCFLEWHTSFLEEHSGYEKEDLMLMFCGIFPDPSRYGFLDLHAVTPTFALSLGNEFLSQGRAIGYHSWQLQQ
jgi:hypothetical protein